MGQAPHDLDPRRRRTRESLQSAFTLLAQQRRYHEIRIDDILKASGVSRSTFYEHFAGKDALLAASMDGALSLLADLPAGKASVPQVAALLAHFWDNRALARSLLQGAARGGGRRARVRPGGDRRTNPRRAPRAPPPPAAVLPPSRLRGRHGRRSHGCRLC